jgi:hypothetical protein
VYLLLALSGSINLQFGFISAHAISIIALFSGTAVPVFLAAYEIPVTSDTLMRAVAGNSIANVTAVTPGGAGVQTISGASRSAQRGGRHQPSRRAATR